MTLKDRVDVVTTIVASIAVVAAAAAAVRGLNTWRTQTKRTFDRDLARRTLKAIYRIRNAIMEFRSGAAAGYEGVSEVWASRRAESAADLISRQAATVDVAKANFEAAWRAIFVANDDLMGELLEVEAAWRKPAREQIAAIQGVVNRLRAAQKIAFERYGNPTEKEHIEALREVFGLLNQDKPDELTLALNSAVQGAEQLLLEKMKL